MVVQARVRLQHEGCFTRRLQGPLHAAQLAADRDGDLLVLHAPHAAGLDALVADAGAGRGPVALVQRAAHSAVVRLGAPHHAPSADLAAAECTPLWPALFADGEESYTVLAPSPEALDDLAARLAQHGHVRIDRLDDVPPRALRVQVPMSDITSALTERQLAVLQAAVAEGYYASPRRTSTETLAARFGVTRSTFEEHLRKAERRVLEGFADVLAAQPVLARAAARRPGRPARAPPERWPVPARAAVER